MNKRYANKRTAKNECKGLQKTVLYSNAALYINFEKATYVVSP